MNADVLLYAGACTMLFAIGYCAGVIHAATARLAAAAANF